MSKIQYSDVIYGFDIETTTVDGVVSHYLSNFQNISFTNGLHQSVGDVISKIENIHWCRTSTDINDYLLKLNAQAIEEEKTIIVFVHNLAYEHDYLIKNVSFYRDNFSNDNCLFIKSRAPLFVRCGHIEFRCSWRLLNKSLKALGDNLGYPKLDIDYQNQYFDFSDLPKIEYDYNERDVKLMLLAVVKECSNWKWIGSVNDIPLTSTGFTRKNNRKINSSSNTRMWAGMCNYQRYYTSEYIDFIESVYTGAYTHSNAIFTGVPLEQVASFDIVSSYIDTILHRQYPHYFIEFEGSFKLGYLKKLIRMNDGCYLDKIRSYQKPFRCGFMTSVKLVNIKAKRLKNNNLILPISFSKCIDFSGVKLDNGRIYQADMIVINISNIDYWIFTQFYDFELVECFKLYHTSYHRELPPFVTESTREYLHEKSTLKRIIADFESGIDIIPDMFYNENKQDYIYDDDIINSICQMSREQQEQTINDNYRASKNKLNGLYGINVQKLRNPIIKYDVDNDEVEISEEDTITAKVLYRDFVKGLYITAYSRLNLFCYALYMIDNTESILIYSDTDSWKIVGDIENAIKVNQEYNKLIESIVHNSDDYDVGKFDHEATYNNFCTLGCKKYVIVEGDKIKITIAGISKSTSQPLTELYHTFGEDFQLFCDIAFSPCTIYDYSITGKLVSKYENDDYCKIVSDCNGDTGLIQGRNMVNLVPSDYILMNVLKQSVRYYIDHFSRLQNRYIETIPTKIYRDSDGVVKYKYITDWKSEITLYKEINHELELSVET